MEATSHRGAGPRTLILSLALIAGLVFGGVRLARFLEGLRREPARTAEETASAVVRVIRAQRTDHRERLEGFGEVRALRQAVVAAEVAGLVTGVSRRLRSGTRVEAGERLVTLDAHDPTETLALGEANLRRAEVGTARVRADLADLDRQLEVARREVVVETREAERLRGLARSGSSSASAADAQALAVSRAERLVLQLERSRRSQAAQIEELAQEVKAREADVARARKDLERTRITAPWGGVVESRAVEVGQRVAPGTEVFRIVDPTRVEVAVVLGASHYADVAVGARMTLRAADGGAALWTGPIVRVAPRVETGDRTFEVFAEVEAATATGPLPPGSFVLATVEGRLHRGVFVLPRTAFLEDRVFVAEPGAGDGALATVAERRPRVERWLAGEAIVTGGLAPGAAVIVTNVEEVVDGLRVRVAEPSGAEVAPAGAPAKEEAPGDGG